MSPLTTWWFGVQTSLGRLAGTKEVSFTTLDGTSDIGHTHTIYYLPETLYVAVAVNDTDEAALLNAGFIKSSEVVLDSWNRHVATACLTSMFRGPQMTFHHHQMSSCDGSP